mmetsp:Transcript_10301/g.19466  ORF Transcript_10301/g.19466 Transcript_10301/m.19466 type:complete len:230 (-) Transcript_10301:143-832(-)
MAVHRVEGVGIPRQPLVWERGGGVFGVVEHLFDQLCDVCDVFDRLKSCALPWGICGPDLGFVVHQVRALLPVRGHVVLVVVYEVDRQHMNVAAGCSGLWWEQSEQLTLSGLLHPRDFCRAHVDLLSESSVVQEVGVSHQSFPQTLSNRSMLLATQAGELPGQTVPRKDFAVVEIFKTVQAGGLFLRRTVGIQGDQTHLCRVCAIPRDTVRFEREQSCSCTVPCDYLNSF